MNKRERDKICSQLRLAEIDPNIVRVAAQKIPTDKVIRYYFLTAMIRNGNIMAANYVLKLYEDEGVTENYEFIDLFKSQILKQIKPVISAFDELERIGYSDRLPIIEDRHWYLTSFASVSCVLADWRKHHSSLKKLPSLYAKNISRIISEKNAEQLVEFRSLTRSLETNSMKNYLSATLLYWSRHFDKAEKILRSEESMKLSRDHLHLLGDILHSKGDFIEAATFYTKANKIFLGGSDTLDGSLDYLKNANKLSEIKTKFIAPEAFKSVAHIIGFPRSGTTLLDNALQNQEGVNVVEESNSFTNSLRLFDSNPQNLKSSYESFLKNYAASLRINGSGLTIDKTPAHLFLLSNIIKLFPEAKFLLCLRNPKDVLVSNFRQKYQYNHFVAPLVDPNFAVKFYDTTMTNFFSTIYPKHHKRIRLIFYEDLVEKTTNTLRSALLFLNPNYSKEIDLDMSKTANSRPANTPSYEKVRAGLGIGIQTYGNNYDSIFNSHSHELLNKWVDLLNRERSSNHQEMTKLPEPELAQKDSFFGKVY